MADTFEAIGRFLKGEIGEEEFYSLEMCACPGEGSCQGLYTANTMACVTEALGLSLSGCGTSLAVSSKKKWLAYQTGKRIVELVKKNLSARHFVRESSLRNAIRVDMALGGSTNTVLHLTAIASEAGIKLDLNFFDKISREVPQITAIAPNGPYLMEDLEYAGGIPAVLNVLKDKLESSDTVDGVDILEIAKKAVVLDEEVIRPLSKPFKEEGGIAVLWGNLAPEGSIVKQAGVVKEAMVFEGKARVFNSEEEVNSYLDSGKLSKGEVLVVRYEGPKGGPGMREMLSPTSKIMGLGFEKDVALITDGRFSGGTRGPCVGHVSPEAAEGGPIALVQDGDTIRIDIPRRKIELLVKDEELDERRKGFKPLKKEVRPGILSKYSKGVKSASFGAILEK